MREAMESRRKDGGEGIVAKVAAVTQPSQRRFRRFDDVGSSDPWRIVRRWEEERSHQSERTEGRRRSFRCAGGGVIIGKPYISYIG